MIIWDNGGHKRTKEAYKEQGVWKYLPCLGSLQKLPGKGGLKAETLRMSWSNQMDRGLINWKREYSMLTLGD